MLHDDRLVRIDDRCERCFSWKRLGILELVETEVERTARRNRESIRTRGITIGEVHRYPYISVAFAGIEEADSLVTGHLRLRTVAPAGDVPFRNGPASSADGHLDSLSRALATTSAK